MTEARFGDLQIVEMGGRDVFTWRQFRADKGEFHPGHKHSIHHVSLLIKGAVTVDYGTHLDTYEAPASIYIDKNLDHTVTAIENETIWVCAFLIPEDGDACELSLET